MPKKKLTKAAFVAEFGKSVFLTDHFILFYKNCNMKVASENNFSIIQLI